MSEPTGRGNQNSGPDQHHDRSQQNRSPQDQNSGSSFSDPTAPLWSDPTAPTPTAPSYEAPSYQEPSASARDTPAPPVPPAHPAPPGAAYPYGQQSAAQAFPPAAPPASNPYAQRPPAQPYGQPPVGQYGQQPPVGQYGQQPPVGPYGQHPSVQAYGQQYPGYGQQPLATGAPREANGSAIALTILSVVSLCNFLTIASLVLGIVALTKNSTDPKGSRRLTKIGWIVFAVTWLVGIVAFFIFVAGAASTGGSSSTTI